MTHPDLPRIEFARNMKLIGHSDQGGRGDGLQVMVHRGYAYIGHPWSGGFSVIDVRDPRDPRPAAFVPAPQNTWHIHLQTHDNLLLVIHARDLFADAAFSADERVYYTRSVGETAGTAGSPPSDRPWSAGLGVYDLTNPTEPRAIGFLPLEGVGVHRIWYVGGRWAYVSALLDGYTDYIFLVVDLADPTRPRAAGRWALPGMNKAGGEVPISPAGQRWALHHALVEGDTAYACWRDGGLTLLDLADREAPQLISHRNWSPPFGGGTHTALPLPQRNLLVVLDEAVLDHQEDGVKHTWVFDIRDPLNPVSLSTFPQPSEADYRSQPGHFGPHNLHESRPGSWQSDKIVFATWQNAGVRAFDLSDPYRPVETGALVPQAPTRMIDRRPGRPLVIQMADVFADRNGLLYCTDYNAGLHIIEYLG
jgi:hypothetical protein